MGDVVARHESLRTVFPSARAVLSAGARPGSGRVAVDRIGPAGRVAAVVAGVGRVRVRPGWRDSASGNIVGGWPGEQVLVLVVHHIAADGWSMGPLVRDLAAAYAARVAGQAPGWAPLAGAVRRLHPVAA